MSSLAFVSRPAACTIHGAGWLDLPDGGRITRLPIYDRDVELFGRLGHGPAGDWAAANGYRLPTVYELDHLHRMALHVEPYTMPTADMLRDEGIGLTEYARINSYRTANMRSLAWCQQHDAEVWQRLKGRGWTSEPVANAGKHWAKGGLIYGWWKRDGSRIQGASMAHASDRTFTDYATTFHVVEESMTGPRRTKTGESGNAVKAWQTWLTSKGFDPGAIDGKHGPKTEAASLMYEASVGVAPSPIPFIQARNYTKTSRTAVQWIVLHSTENKIRPGVARNVATWFAGPTAPQASAHYVVGPDETIQCVEEKSVAWGAPSANRQGIHIEMVGQAARTNWDTDGTGETDGRKVMERAAKLTREIAARWSVPLERVDATGLRAGRRGITTHAAVTEAFRTGSHVDPGMPGDRRWPWEAFLGLVTKA